MQKLSRDICIDDFNNQISDSTYIKYFTSEEIETFGKRKNTAGLAARYLIKKILIEWIGKGLKPLDIAILNNEYGRPQLFSKKISEEVQKKIHFSVSHTKTKAIVMVIIDK